MKPNYFRFKDQIISILTGTNICNQGRGEENIGPIKTWRLKVSFNKQLNDKVARQNCSWKTASLFETRDKKKHKEKKKKKNSVAVGYRIAPRVRNGHISTDSA